MITGVHALIYSKDAEALRAFFKNVLGFPSVDAGHGWLIFGLPAAELAAHPAENGGEHELYLMCDDIHATVNELSQKGAEFAGPITEQGFGSVASIKLPGGGKLGIYQPRHPTALSLSR
jgi:predicted enzyme related to lactoylglutathione lyase